MSREEEDLERPGFPLRVEYSEPSEAQVDAAYEWLLSLSVDGGGGLAVAEKWLSGLEQAVSQEGELQGGPFVFQRMQSADSKPERARYVLRYRSGGKRSSPWEVVYELHDVDADGILDTLRVVAVLHGARDRPQP